MMLLLRKLADKGHTIILVTHATSNINVCDYVCFLAQGGRVAYFGPPEDASAYFEQPGFAEIYGVLEPTNEDPDLPVEVRERFRSSPAYQRYVEAPLEGRPTAPALGDRSNAQRRQIRAPWRWTGWKQFVILSTRYLELLWNRPPKSADFDASGAGDRRDALRLHSPTQRRQHLPWAYLAIRAGGRAEVPVCVDVLLGNVRLDQCGARDRQRDQHLSARTHGESGGFCRTSSRRSPCWGRSACCNASC